MTLSAPWLSSVNAHSIRRTHSHLAVRHLRAQGTRFEVRYMDSGFTLAGFADWLQRKGQVGFRLRTSGNGPREQGESKREPSTVCSQSLAGRQSPSCTLMSAHITDWARQFPASRKAINRRKAYSYAPTTRGHEPQCWGVHHALTQQSGIKPSRPNPKIECVSV